MKKIVVKLHVHDVKQKQKAMQAVSTISGIESFELDMNEQRLILTGDIDPVEIVAKLRKHWFAEIVSFGPQPEKKKEDNKTDDETKKADTKTDDEDEEEEEEKRIDDEEQQLADLIMANEHYYPNPYHQCVQTNYYYRYVPQQQYPNTCVIS